MLLVDIHIEFSMPYALWWTTDESASVSAELGGSVSRTAAEPNYYVHKSLFWPKYQKMLDQNIEAKNWAFFGLQLFDGNIGLMNWIKF